MSKEISVTKNEGMLSLPAIREEGLLSKSYDMSQLKTIMDEIYPNGIPASSLEKLRMNGTNATEWEIETSTGIEKVTSVTGILLCRMEGIPVRARYTKKYDPKEVRQPDCKSLDGVVGIGDPGGYCSKCEHTKMGSDCLPKKSWYFIHGGNFLMSFLSVPLTSQKYFAKYIDILAREKRLPWQVLTEITYTNRPNDRCSSMSFLNVGLLSPEDRVRVESLRGEIMKKPVMEAEIDMQEPDGPGEEIKF